MIMFSSSTPAKGTLNGVSKIREDGTATLCLTLEDGDSPLIQAAVLASSPEQAERWAETFKKDPAAFYHGVIKLLDREGLS